MKTKSIVTSATLAILAAAVIALSGCAAPSTGGEPHTHALAASAPTVATGKGGAQLWAENCARCHNIRPTTSYSDAQWDVAMMHMRVRANLTAEESRKILAFLKSAD